MHTGIVRGSGHENRRWRAALLVPLLLVFLAAALPATGYAALTW
jgi:hypothetical protein